MGRRKAKYPQSTPQGAQTGIFGPICGISVCRGAGGETDKGTGKTAGERVKSRVKPVKPLVKRLKIRESPRRARAVAETEGVSANTPLTSINAH